MTKNILTKATSLTLAIAFALVGFGSDALAYGITGLSVNDIAAQTAEAPGDIRQQVGEESEHFIDFTLDADTNIDIGENIIVTFSSGTDAGENFDFNGITDADVDVLVDGAAVALTTDYTVAITPAATNVDGVITITAVTAFATANQEVTIAIGDDSTRIINPTVPSEDADDNETGLGEENFYKITVTGDFGTEGGVAHAVKAATIHPVLDEDQVHVYAYIMPQLVFNMDSGDTSYNNGNDTSNAGSCAAGTADDDDQTCDFFTDYANSIDFGMPSSTATSYATPTHPSEVMNGGDTASNIADGGAHGFHVGTNAVNGLVTTVWGETLTHANNVDTIAAIGAAAAASAAGTDQFGFCLAQDDAGVDGTDATVNPAPAGAQIAAIPAAFDCAGTGYAFAATAAGAATPVLNTILSSTGPTSTTFVDMEYVLNIDASTPAGLYDTDLTFITTGLF